MKNFKLIEMPRAEMSPKSYCKHQPVSRPKSLTSRKGWLEERRGFCGMSGGKRRSRNWNWCNFNCKIWTPGDIIFVISWKYL